MDISLARTSAALARRSKEGGSPNCSTTVRLRGTQWDVLITDLQPPLQVLETAPPTSQLSQRSPPPRGRGVGTGARARLEMLCGS